MRTLAFARVALKVSLIQFRRYLFDTLSGLIVVFFAFLLIFFGARSLMAPGPDTGDTLSAIVVGFAIWFLAIMGYSATTQSVIEESMAGTLEQRALSPLGLVRVLVLDFAASIVITATVVSTLLVLMMAVSGRWLHIDVVSLVPLGLLTLLGVFGIGLAAGGVAMVAKRLQNFLQILQFVFVALIAAPLDRLPFVKYLPLAWGNHLISRVMIDEVSITDMLPDVGFLVVNSLAWFALGVVVFRFFEDVARERALLGHY